MPAPHRTGIPQARHRALKSFALEVMLVQRSFQPPPLPTVRVVGGHVVLALARHVEARLLAFAASWSRLTRYENRVAGEIQPGDYPHDHVNASLRASRSGFTVKWSVHAGFGLLEYAWNRPL